MQSLTINRGFFIVTPPRCGTHMLVDSISTMFNRHSVRFQNYNQSFWNHPTVKRNDSVIGIHCHNEDHELLEFASNRQIITTDRHPIGQALSILAMYKRGAQPEWDSKNKFNIKKFVKSNPNSEEFIKYVKSQQFKEFRSITNQWKPLGLCVNFDKLLEDDISEHNKISEFLGQDFKLKDITKVQNKYEQGIVFMGEPNLWRGVIAQDVADEIGKDYPEYDMTTLGNTHGTGNWIFDTCLNI
jgi:hypothetical protein